MSLVDVGVCFPVAGEEVVALAEASLAVLPATSTSIVGRSGSGKSTLISLLSLLRRPTTGSVLVGGEDVAALSDAALSSLRASMVSTVFQSFHLDPAFTAIENVLLPWYFSARCPRRRARQRAKELLEVVGIPELSSRRPGQMSGGQRQRVAIARALFTEPPLLIADEPTGNLDEDTAAVIGEVLYGLPTRLETAVVVVTHDAGIAAAAQIQLAIKRGRLEPVDVAIGAAT